MNHTAWCNRDHDEEAACEGMAVYVDALTSREGICLLVGQDDQGGPALVIDEARGAARGIALIHKFSPAQAVALHDALTQIVGVLRVAEEAS